MKWVVERPVATWMITIALFVFGIVSYQRLPLNLMPDLSYPTITVRTEAEGYAPEEVEEQISRKLEEAVATTQGLAHMESRSRAGISEILLSFKWESNLDQSIQDVRERMQRVFLADDIKRPLLLRYDPSADPIIRLAVSGGTSQTQLRNFCENIIKQELEAIDGIAAVKVRGGSEQEIQVFVREDWLAAKGITIDKISETLSSENINMPAGSILEGDREYLVRTLNAFTTLDELKHLKISKPDGTQIPLSELADIQYGKKERSVLSRLNAEEAVELEIYKTADANIVQVTNQLRTRLFSGEESLDKQLPEGTVLNILEDQASFVEASINNLKNTALAGALCAIFILFVFLRNFRATAIIGAAIPLSIVVTFAPIYLAGVSLNLMSLGGLALGIGMLVDNAVVVLENIQVHMDRGSSRKEAAAKGSSEVAMAVTASTLTTISVFLPISFVDGIAGQIFTDLSLAVVFSLLASLAVALFFVPMLAASSLSFSQETAAPSFKARFHAFSEFKNRFTHRSALMKWVGLLWDLPYLVIFLSFEIFSTLVLIPIVYGARFSFGIGRWILPKIAHLLMRIANIFYGIYERFETSYKKSLSPLITRPGLILGSALLLLVLSLQVGSSLGQSLIPDIHQGRIFVDAELPIGTPLGKTSSQSKILEERFATDPEIEYVHAVIGADSSDDRSGVGEHSVRYLIGLKEHPKPQKQETEVINRLRVELSNQKTFRNAQFSRPSLFQFQTPFELVIFNDNLKELPNLSAGAKRKLDELGIFTDLQSSLTEGYPELQIEYNREKLKSLGLSSAQVAQTVRKKIQGEKATSISTLEDRIDLVVRLTEGDRRSTQQLAQLNINPNVIPEIPLSSVATISEQKGPSEIRRIDQQRSVVISANVKGFDLVGPTKAIQDSFAQWDDWEISGQSRELGKSTQSMIFSIALAIFLVYVIMASTFEHIIHPLVILFTVPLAIIGVLFALWLFSVPLSIVVFIGLIVLAGVVVNNAIVLVDTINRERSNGKSPQEATLISSSLRLRPILITTLTTALGLLPLAFGYGEGAEIQQPLALTIIAGLLSSTALTLLVIPAVYLLLTPKKEKQQ
jgi:HAE1 family hydrophobic/amphiphilic exporter-1